MSPHPLPRRVLAPSLLLAAILCTSTAGADLSIPHQRTVLPNGLTVLLSPGHRDPMVTVEVRYHVGAAQDPQGRSGLAHLVEHLMFQHTAHMRGNLDAFYYLGRMAAYEYNAFTDHDSTVFYEVVPAPNVELALWLEAERMGFLLDALTADSVRREVHIVQDERHEHLDAGAGAQVGRVLFEALFPAGHPYHLPVGGLRRDLEAASLSDVVEFHRSHYQPKNATLVLSGDFDAARTANLVTRYFASLEPGGPPPVPGALPAPGAAPARPAPAPGPRQILVLGWPTPPVYRPGDATADLVAAILSRGGMGRLDRRARGLGGQVRIGAAQHSMGLQSVFRVQVAAREPAAFGPARAAVEEELQRLGAAPPAQAELEAARTHVVIGNLASLDTRRGITIRLGNYQQFLGNSAWLKQDLVRYDNVTPEEVSAFARSYLAPDKQAVVVVSAEDGGEL